MQTNNHQTNHYKPMCQTREKKHPYVPPLVLQTVGVLVERSFLAGSGIVDSLNLAGQDTVSQDVDNTDFSDTSFNFVWE